MLFTTLRFLALVGILLAAGYPDFPHLEATEPVVLARGKESQAPVDPQAAIDPNGVVHVVFGVLNRVYYCRSSDRGKSFSSPREIASVPNLSLGLRRGPRIVAGNDGLAVSIIGGVQGKGRDGDLLVWTSKDLDDSWNGPVRVNGVSGSAREGLHGMAISQTGTIWCTWLDLRNNRTEVFVSKSTDGGRHWSENTIAYRSPERSVCECCHPSISAFHDSVAVMFRNSLKGNRDMYVAIAKDGNEFSTARKLDLFSWQLNACPMDGGMVAMFDADNFDAIWMRKGSVLRWDASKSVEVELGKGNQPWIARLGDDPIAVWTSGKRGDLTLLGGPFGKKVISGDCSNPVVVSGGKASDPMAVACWESKHEGESSIQALVVSPLK